MARKAYVRNFLGELEIEQGFVELDELLFGEEPSSYLVTANFSVQRRGSDGSMRILFRLEVLSPRSQVLGSDEVTVHLDAVEGYGSLVSGVRDPVQFRHGVIYRQVSLTVPATIPDERHFSSVMAPPGEGFDEGMAIIGQDSIVPTPRAILSASGDLEEREGGGAYVNNIRMIAFPADEIVVTTNV